MTSIFTSAKTRQANRKLRGINDTLFDNFMKKDLKVLRKKSDAMAIIREAKKSESNIFKYATLLKEQKNLNDFEEAIDLQSKSKGTKHEGLFYRLIFANKDILFNPEKLQQMQSKVKAFLLATNEKDKDISDEEVNKEDQSSKRMHNSSIVKKLNSSRLSNILKVFIALVAYTHINEEAKLKAVEEAAAEAGREEAKRRVERIEAEKKAKENNAERQFYEAAEAAQYFFGEAEKEAARKAAEEEAARKAAEEEAARKAAEAEAARKAAEEKAARKAKKSQQISQLKANREIIIEEIKKYLDSKPAFIGEEYYNPITAYCVPRQIANLKEKIKSSELLKELCYELAYITYCNIFMGYGANSYFTLGVDIFSDVSGSEFSTTISNEEFGKFVDFLRKSKILSSFSMVFIQDLSIVWQMIPDTDRSDRQYRDYVKNKDLKKAERLKKIIDYSPDTEKTPTIAPKTSYRKQESLQILENVNKDLEKIKNACGKTSEILVKATQELMVKPLQKLLQEVKEKEKSAKDIDTSQRYVPYGGKVAGCGGFGKVRIYFDNETKQKVAVKTKRDGGPFNKSMVEAAKKIKSDYVAKVLDLIDVGEGKENGLVMEYVHGKASFSWAIKRFGSDNKKILEICLQLVDGFRALAEAGFAQWDLNQHSNNILIDRDGNIKIIDYDDEQTYSGDTEKGIANAVEQVASILVSSDHKLFESFKNKLNIKLKPSNRNDLSLAEIFQYRGQTHFPTFDELINVLEQLKREV